MSRTLNAATQAALASDDFNVATLVRLDFPTILRLTDWNRDITAFSSTFVSSPDLTSTPGVTENAELRVNTTEIEFGGESQTYAALILTNDYMDVRGRVWKAVLDSSESIVGSPILFFDGRIVSYAIEDDDKKSRVGVSLASHWKDFDLKKGRLTNSNSQNLYFPSDRGFDFAHETRKDIKWGKT